MSPAGIGGSPGFAVFRIVRTDHLIAEADQLVHVLVRDSEDAPQHPDRHPLAECRHQVTVPLLQRRLDRIHRELADVALVDPDRLRSEVGGGECTELAVARGVLFEHRPPRLDLIGVEVIQRDHTVPGREGLRIA